MINNKEHIYDILREDLMPAMGCTEPIAIAYASAKARQILGEMPSKIIAECSGNIIKNVKGVIVPNSNNMRGIDTSAVLGAVGGDCDRKLEVLATINEEHIKISKELLKKGICTVKMLDTSDNLHIRITAIKDDNTTTVEIKNSHTDIVSITKNGEILSINDVKKLETSNLYDKIKALSVKTIYDFVNTADVSKLKEILKTQIEYNMLIAEEGLKNSYGVNIGSLLVKNFGQDVKILAKAYPSAGSDARMSGCSLPVVINSGSGNQGLTVSLPVIVYAQKLEVSEEKLYKALAFSNLLAIYQKSKIGKLSAYCGVVSAACASGAAISYLHDMPFDNICKTITNTLANVSGIVCDGAKPSCAAKIASSVEAAIMGHLMAIESSSFASGEGLVKENIEKTIDSFGTMGRVGMRQTDIEILKLMID